MTSYAITVWRIDYTHAHLPDVIGQSHLHRVNVRTYWVLAMQRVQLHSPQGVSKSMKDKEQACDFYRSVSALLAKPLDRHPSNGLFPVGIRKAKPIWI